MVVVEDVITTGGSTREVMAAVVRRGARVVAVGSLVDRSGGVVDLGVARAGLLDSRCRPSPPPVPALRRGIPAGEARVAYHPR